MITAYNYDILLYFIVNLYFDIYIIFLLYTCKTLEDQGVTLKRFLLQI